MLAKRMTAGGNLSTTPAAQSVTRGRTTTVTAQWTGLTPGRTYLGVIEYRRGATVSGQTVLVVQA